MTVNQLCQTSLPSTNQEKHLTLETGGESLLLTLALPQTYPEGALRAQNFFQVHGTAEGVSNIEELPMDVGQQPGIASSLNRRACGDPSTTLGPSAWPWFSGQLPRAHHTG